MSKDLRVLEVGVDMTDEEVGRFTAVADEACVKGPWFFVVRGFDSDPREVWEIPEVLALIDRLDAVGFATVLDAEATPDSFQRPLLDGFRFWLMRTRQLRTNMELSLELGLQFFDWLKASNQRCDANTAKRKEPPCKS